jgi:hypothetical protein
VGQGLQRGGSTGAHVVFDCFRLQPADPEAVSRLVGAL